jgi:hypothetical protein
MISLTHQSFLGFDYNFHAIRDETNELFCAYREMFEVAISQGRFFRTMLDIYLPYLSAHFVSMSIHVASPIETFVGLSQIKPRVLYNDVKGHSSRCRSIGCGKEAQDHGRRKEQFNFCRKGLA